MNQEFGGHHQTFNKMVLFDIIHSHKQFGCQLAEMVKESKTGDTDEKPKVAPNICNHVREPIGHQLLLSEQ